MPKDSAVAKLKSIPHKIFSQTLAQNGGKVAEAYQRAYPAASYNTARANGSKLLAQASIQQSIIEIMNQKGITDNRLVEKLGKMLDAKKEVLDNSGNIVQLECNTTQMNALNTSLKLRGHLQEQGTVNIHIGTSVQTPAELARLDRIIQTAQRMMVECGLIKAQATDAQVVEVERGARGVGEDELDSLSASA